LNEASPFSYTRLAPKHVGGFGGEGNYWVPVSVCTTYSYQRICVHFIRSTNRQKIMLLCWCFGSLIPAVSLPHLPSLPLVS
jgi:hypothetical protein